MVSDLLVKKNTIFNIYKTLTQRPTKFLRIWEMVPKVKAGCKAALGPAPRRFNIWTFLPVPISCKSLLLRPRAKTGPFPRQLLGRRGGGSCYYGNPNSPRYRYYWMCSDYSAAKVGPAGSFSNGCHGSLLSRGPRLLVPFVQCPRAVQLNRRVMKKRRDVGTAPFGLQTNALRLFRYPRATKHITGREPFSIFAKARRRGNMPGAHSRN